MKCIERGFTEEMKKKIIPVLVVTGLILLVICGILLSNLIKKYAPSKEHVDLSEYYGISSEDSVLIMMNYENVESQGILIDDTVYLDYDFVHDYINARFYWDGNENILLYTTSNSIISANIDESSYTENKDSVDFGSTIVTISGEQTYVNIDFVKKYTKMEYSYYEDPNRIVVTTEFGTVATATAKKNTYLRVLGGIKSPIIQDISKKDTLTIISADEKWTEVMTADGFIGYVKSSTLSSTTDVEVTTDFEEETFNHITKDFDICMGWNALYSYAANDNIANVLASSDGINVISPTWFYVNDNDGNLHDMASSSYVSMCHNQGIEVWALVSNLENSDIDTTYILTHTSVRNNLVNQIVSAAIQYDLDGINLDFESVSPEVGDGYIQLVRELSVKLENNGIVLSVDNYVPSDYTAFYNRSEQALFADYVVIMGYDQHYAGSEETGSVAALDWVSEAVTNTMSEVPAEQIILAMPFYTRLWCKTPQGDTGDSDTDQVYSISSDALGMAEANSLIESKGAEKTWLSDAGQFYATYTENGNIYEIWLENSDSLEERLKLMQDSTLAGCAFWRLGFETSDVWNTVDKYFD